MSFPAPPGKMAGDLDDKVRKSPLSLPTVHVTYEAPAPQSGVSSSVGRLSFPDDDPNPPIRRLTWKGHRIKPTRIGSINAPIHRNRTGYHYEKLSFSKTIHSNKLTERSFLPPIRLQRGFFQPLAIDMKQEPVNDQHRTVQYYHSKGRVIIRNTESTPFLKVD